MLNEFVGAIGLVVARPKWELEKAIAGEGSIGRAPLGAYNALPMDLARGETKIRAVVDAWGTPIFSFRLPLLTPSWTYKPPWLHSGTRKEL